MRKLDWIAAAVIGVFLAGAVITQAAAWAVSGLASLAPDGVGARHDLVARVVSISADWRIERLGPTIFRRP